jgi:peptide/nickel transport system substrate-binding protein/oligopeptide transport system substrate-binding protein
VGNLDLLTIPQAEFAYWQNEDRPLLRQQQLSVTYLGLNLQKPPLDDLRVRQALNRAIDVPAIMKTLRGDAAIPARGPVPPALRSRDPEEVLSYDPQEARKLLQEAGLPDGFEMEIWQKENPETSRLLEAVQSYLAEVGVRVKIVVRDWGAFKEAINQGSADAFVMDWLADYPDAENFLYPLFHSSNRGGGGNRCGMEDPWMDLMLEELRLRPAGAAREELVNRINESLYRKAAWIWLWHPVTLQVIRPGIRGYEAPVIFNGQDYREMKSGDPHRP